MIGISDKVFKLSFLNTTMVKFLSNSLVKKTLHRDLKMMMKQKNFNNWQYNTIKPYLKGDILETGSGCGTFSEKIVKDFRGKIYLTENDKFFIGKLKKRFKSKRVKVIYSDLNNEKNIKEIENEFDSVVCLNVLEHVENDILALNSMRKLLRSGGNLILLVPAHKSLYSPIDRALGHYRRYSKEELEEKTEKAGFKTKKAFWFNMLAIPGRLVSGNMLKNKELDSFSLSVFNKLVPLFSFIESKILFNSIGISRVLILEK